MRGCDIDFVRVTLYLAQMMASCEAFGIVALACGISMKLTCVFPIFLCFERWLGPCVGAIDSDGRCMVLVKVASFRGIQNGDA